MATSGNGKREEALALLRFQDLGVLSTYDPEYGPTARALYYAADDSFNLYFLTFSNTRKVTTLLEHSKAAFVVYDRAKPATIQMQGVLADHSSSGKIDDPIVKELVDRVIAKGGHFAPLTHLDSAPVSFIKLTPTWIRYGDFSSGLGKEEVFTEISP